MAGHSQFKNIMHRKGAQDAKRARAFAKLAREIQVATKLGSPDPSMNPRLRSAIATARSANMPKDNIERAIKKGIGDGDDTEFHEVRYEGYGPGGVAIIVEALTDNRNRTAAEIRTAFSKHGGNLGETGSVGFMFERLGQILFTPGAGSADAVFEAAVESGADDVTSGDDGHVVKCAPDNFHAVREALAERLGEPPHAQLIWWPQSPITVGVDAATPLLKLIDVLDDNEDVQSVSANFDIGDDVMAHVTT